MHEQSERETARKALRQVQTVARGLIRADRAAEAAAVLIVARDHLIALSEEAGVEVARTSQCPPAWPNCDPPEDPPPGGG